MTHRFFFRLHRALVTLVLAGIATAQAHDIVLVPEARQLRVRYGHPQDWQPVDREKLLDLQILQGDAAPRDVRERVKRRGDEYVADKARLGVGADAWLASARYDNGLWVELPAVGSAEPQWRNASRFTQPEAKAVMASIKFAKAYQGRASDPNVWQRRVGHLVELVPQKNPLGLKPGETLPVLLLMDGKPLAGAALECRNLVDKLAEDKIVRYTTGVDGIAQVMIRPRGVNMIGVDLERPNDGSLGASAKALPVDKLLMIATYTFVR